MGEGARRRLHMFAANFDQRLNNMKDKGGSPTGQQRGNLEEDSGAVAERRGLLDDDEEEISELLMRRVTVAIYMVMTSPDYLVAN